MIDDDLLNDITRLVKEDKRRKKKQQQKKQKGKKDPETPPAAVPSPRGDYRFGKLFTKNKKKGGVFTKKNNHEHPPIPTTITIRHDCCDDDDYDDSETYSLDENNKPKTKLCAGEKISPASPSSSSLIDNDNSSSSFSSGGDSSINSAAQYSSPDEEEEDSNAITIEVGRTPSAPSAQQDEHADRNNGGEQKHSRITAPSPPQLQPQPKQRISKFKKIFQKKKTKR